MPFAKEAAYSKLSVTEEGSTTSMDSQATPFEQIHPKRPSLFGRAWTVASVLNIVFFLASCSVLTMAYLSRRGEDDSNCARTTSVWCKCPASSNSPSHNGEQRRHSMLSATRKSSSRTDSTSHRYTVVLLQRSGKRPGSIFGIVSTAYPYCNGKAADSSKVPRSVYLKTNFRC
jgi:hypothetical protein